MKIKEEINSQFIHQLDRLKSTDTTESNMTIIETVDTVAPTIRKVYSIEQEELPLDNPPTADETKKLCNGSFDIHDDKTDEEREEETDKILISQVPKKRFVKRESVKSLMGDGKPLTSCLLRRGSSKSSFKKKVMYSESTEVIPEPEYFINEDELFPEAEGEDDDDVFSDNLPTTKTRGNMCTPYSKRKGSLPSLKGLPEWFQDDSRCFNRSNPQLHPFMVLFLSSLILNLRIFI